MTEDRHLAAAREWLDGFIARMKASDAATSTFSNDRSLAALLARVESEARKDERRIHDENCIAIVGPGIAPHEVSEGHCYTAEAVREKVRRAECEERERCLAIVNDETMCSPQDISATIRALEPSKP